METVKPPFRQLVEFRGVENGKEWIEECRLYDFKEFTVTYKWRFNKKPTHWRESRAELRKMAKNLK